MPNQSEARPSCLMLVDSSEMEFISHTRIASLLVGEGTVCTHPIFRHTFRVEPQIPASVKQRGSEGQVFRDRRKISVAPLAVGPHFVEPGAATERLPRRSGWICCWPSTCRPESTYTTGMVDAHEKNGQPDTNHVV